MLRHGDILFFTFGHRRTGQCLVMRGSTSVCNFDIECTKNERVAVTEMFAKAIAKTHGLNAQAVDTINPNSIYQYRLLDSW